MEMTVQLDLDFTQVKRLVDRLPQKEKETLARYLCPLPIISCQQGQSSLSAKPSHRDCSCE